MKIMQELIDLYLHYQYFTVPLSIFIVIRFNHRLDDEPTVLREDEKEGRARSWLFGFIRSSTDNEEITSHGTTDEGYGVTTRNKYGEETDYIISEEED